MMKHGSKNQKQSAFVKKYSLEDSHPLPGILRKETLQQRERRLRRLYESIHGKCSDDSQQNPTAISTSMMEDDTYYARDDSDSMIDPNSFQITKRVSDEDLEQTIFGYPFLSDGNEDDSERDSIDAIFDTKYSPVLVRRDSLVDAKPETSDRNSQCDFCEIMNSPSPTAVGSDMDCFAPLEKLFPGVEGPLFNSSLTLKK